MYRKGVLLIYTVVFEILHLNWTLTTQLRSLISMLNNNIIIRTEIQMAKLHNDRLSLAPKSVWRK